MKHFKIPKFEKSDGDYKLWGLSIPKLPNKHPSPKRNRQQKTVTASTTPVTATATTTTMATVIPADSVADSRSVGVDVVDADASSVNRATENFTDIVFSFFSSNDQQEQHYVVHRSADSECASPELGNHYEIMNANEEIRPPPRLHKSELTFYVSAASLKEPEEDDDPTRYELPLSDSPSPYTVKNKSLNDLRTAHKEEDAKYQNSASLDNLSQVCNASLKNFDRGYGSRRSISSLPEYDTIGRKRKDFIRSSFTFSKISAAVSSKSPMKIDYFDNAKAVRLKNRLSAFYKEHKGFKSKKRFSKAWYGFKEWFDVERSKLDKVVRNKNPIKKDKHLNNHKSSDDYPDSDFSDYEDVDVHVSLDSFGKEDDFGDSSVISGGTDALDKSKNDNRSRSVCSSVLNKFGKETRVLHVNDDDVRHSRSQSSVLEISEPVLVKINCESVDEADGSDGEQRNGDVEPSPPDRESTKSDNPPDGTQTYQREGQNKYAELRSAVKEGSVACKELFALLQQRAEAERQYACAVLRVGARARRAARNSGTVALTAKGIALDMEARAQLHRQFSNHLVDEVIRSLQRLVSSRDAIRKQVESDVNRTARRLSELRAIEARMKKLSHAAARFNERMQDTGIAKGSTPTQETEVRRKKNKAEEAATKADVEYYMSCLRAERARVEWETTVVKSSEILIGLEEERWVSTKRALKRYIALASTLGPGSPLEEASTLEENFDAELVEEKRITQDYLIQSPPAMHLPDFYCQHMTLAMNKERRKRALIRIIQLIKTDTERERKSKQALEKLAQAITTTPNFGANDSQQNVSEKLYHMKSLLTYLEGARIQAVGALASLTGRGRVPHPLSPHLKIVRDRRGLQQTILTVPPWLQHEYKFIMKNEIEDGGASTPPSSPTTPALTSRCSDRGAADGVSIQHYSDVDDSTFEDPPERPPPPKLDVRNAIAVVHTG